jgi:hypothetical protein
VVPFGETPHNKSLVSLVPPASGRGVAVAVRRRRRPSQLGRLCVFLLVLLRFLGDCTVYLWPELVAGRPAHLSVCSMLQGPVRLNLSVVPF